MMEIQTRSTALQSPQPQPASPQAQSAKPALTGAAIATAPMPKAEIKVNVEQMKKNLDQAIGQLNDNMRDGGRNLAFAMDEVLGRPVIVVKKEDTGEVIRQIPNEVVIKVAHNMDKLKGLLLNTRA
jgi:flagellar protein FlaG